MTCSVLRTLYPPADHVYTSTLPSLRFLNSQSGSPGHFHRRSRRLGEESHRVCLVGARETEGKLLLSGAGHKGIRDGETERAVLSVPLKTIRYGGPAPSSERSRPRGRKIEKLKIAPQQWHGLDRSIQKLPSGRPHLLYHRQGRCNFVVRSTRQKTPEEK